MFGLMTKAEHERVLAEKLAQKESDAAAILDSYALRLDEAHAQIDHLRPLAEKHLARVAQAKRNLKQNRRAA